MDTLLLTGASGFLGRNLLPGLRARFSVTTLGRSEGNDVRADLSDGIPGLPGAFDMAVHAAGLAHQIPHSRSEMREYYRINVDGTRNLCSALEKCGLPRTFVFISTVSVYGAETGTAITEDSPLDGKSAYARSKIEAEKLVTQWCRDHGVNLVILRPTLILGDRPSGNLGAMIRGIKRGYYCNIGGGDAHRSLALAPDIANVIALCPGKSGIFNICSSETPTVGQMARHIADALGKKHVLSVPMWLARVLALPGIALGNRWPLDPERLGKMTSDLTFDNTRARTILGWRPMNALDNFQINL